jgi:DNA-binding response OmpR family regulator
MKAKILIADDEEDLVKALKIRLQTEGYEVLTAFNGIQAIEVTHKFHPDLILLDIMMPAGDGYSVCEKLKESTDTSNIPVIFLTAKTLEHDERKGYVLGAEYYIKKPFDTDQLLEIIKKALISPEELKEKVRKTKIFKLLIFTDNEGITEVLLPKLEKENFSYKLVKGKEEFSHALEMELPQIMVMDIYLKNWNINSILEEIVNNQNWRQIPLILMGAPGDTMRFQSWKQKIKLIKILENPYDISEILIAIRSYIKGEEN